jgi:hypothetical protein
MVIAAATLSTGLENPRSICLVGEDRLGFLAKFGIVEQASSR